jgi:septal ring factor EnvC (AmiA/AmiB activator)
MRVVAVLVFLLISFQLSAQQQPSRTELEKQRQQLLISIRETQEQLEATKKDQKATVSQLRALQAKLNARQRLIDNINQEIGNIDNTIQSSSAEVSQLQRRLELQQMGYARSIRYAYRHRNSYNTLVFIFSAQDYNDALRRMKYLKKYRDYRRGQVAEIRRTQEALKSKIDVLHTQKTQKSMLLTAEEQQRQELVKETNETDAVVRELKGREKELAQEIEKARRAARQVDQQINKIIQREIELARKKAEEEERKKREEERRRKEEEQRKAAAAQAAQAAQQKALPPPDGNVYGGVKLNTGSGASGGAKPATPAATKPATGTAGKPIAETHPEPAPPPRPKAEPPSYMLSLTPEVAALSSSFEANKGKLPWPVEKGFISLGFGPYKHPTEPRIMLDNAGVSISTSLNANVRAVFDGTVSSAFYVSGAGWTVVLSHGQYYTVYSGLAKATVEKGQSVKIKQSVGIVGENEEGVPVINFQVWKVGANNKTFKIDPAGWIAR